VISIINPSTNRVENEIAFTDGGYAAPLTAAYLPNTNRIYIGSGAPNLKVIDPGRILNNGLLTGAKYEDQLTSQALTPHGYSEITKICANPEMGYLYLFDGTQNRSAVVFSNYLRINKDKDGVHSYDHSYNMEDWMVANQNTKDVIYCPFDGAVYWLSSRANAGTYVFRMGSDYSKTIKIKSGNFEKLLYCPDNNMVYVFGPDKTEMINPADSKGTVPVSAFYDNIQSLNGVAVGSGSGKLNGVCYSPHMNRIYGVGDSGYIKYLDPTT
jgi:hypothetical protein